MRERISIVLATGMACGTLLSTAVLAGVDPVERLTGPQQSAWDGTEAFTAFSDVIADGTAFGWSYEPAGTGRLFNVAPDGGEWPIEGMGDLGIRDVSANGRWILGSRSFSYGPGECSFDGGDSSTRPLLFDIENGATRYFTALCPNFSTWSISHDARTAVGQLYRGDRSAGTPADAAVWRDGEITLLDLPDFGSPGLGDVESLARMVSGDGRVAVGSAFVIDRLPSEARFGEAIRWIDGVPEVLPHFPSASAEAQTSLGIGLSADGSVVYGRTTNWDFDGLRWDWTDQTSWIMRNGKMTDLRVPNQNHALHGITGDGSLLYGADFAAGPAADWRGIVWSEANGIESADAWLARLGIDLGGQIVRQVIDVSDDGAWMLVALRVDDTTQQFARISVPCSPADVTADRSITIDDATAYADRFTAANPLADLTADGVLDLADVARFVSLYGVGCGG